MKLVMFCISNVDLSWLLGEISHSICPSENLAPFDERILLIWDDNVDIAQGWEFVVTYWEGRDAFRKRFFTQYLKRNSSNLARIKHLDAPPPLYKEGPCALNIFKLIYFHSDVFKLLDVTGKNCGNLGWELNLRPNFTERLCEIKSFTYRSSSTVVTFMEVFSPKSNDVWWWVVAEAEVKILVDSISVFSLSLNWKINNKPLALRKSIKDDFGYYEPFQ